MLLYKYRPFDRLDYVADILVNQRLYCSPFRALNDPYEGTAILSHTLKVYEDEARTITVTGKGKPSTIKTSISGGVIIPGAENLNEWRVCSLSETAGEVRLWSFYGGAHMGLVVAIDFEVDPSDSENGEQVVTHQPAISFSISIHFPFNRAGGRTSNVRQKIRTPP